MQFYILLCTKCVIIQDWVTFGIFVFRFAFPYYDLFHFVKLYYAYVISCMALSGQKLDGRAGEWVSLSATLFLVVFLPSAVKIGDNVDKTDKTSIDQGLKLLREATDLLSGSLSDNIPLVNSTSIPNADRIERIASNLCALFSAYDCPESRDMQMRPRKNVPVTFFFYES